MTELPKTTSALNFETAVLKAAERVYSNGQGKIDDKATSNLLLANAAVKKYVEDMQGCPANDAKAKAEAERYSKLSAVFSKAIERGAIDDTATALTEIKALTTTMQNESLSAPRIKCLNTPRLPG